MPGTFLLIGEPGSGKTTTACTGVPPILLIDADCKAHNMVNLKPLIKSGDLKILPIKHPLVEGSMRERMLDPNKPIEKLPEGFLYNVDLLNEIIDGHEYDGFNTIVQDSATRMTDHLKRLLVYLRGQGKFGKIKGGEVKEGDMNWPSWGTYLADLEEVFQKVCSYFNEEDCKRTFVCTVHQMDKTDVDPITKATINLGHWPQIDGQFRTKMAGYFDECYYLERVTDILPGNVVGVKYQMRTMGTYHKCARSSMGLPQFVKPNIKALINYGQKIST